MSMEDELLWQDLLWAVQGPELIDLASTPFCDLASLVTKYRAKPLQTNVPALRRLVAKRQSKQLGRYFEDLIEFFLRESFPSWEMTRGLQVHHAENTAGEFDFLLRSFETSLHLETAIKFYLYVPGQNGFADCWGPNANDRLDKKWQKLYDQQLRLELPQEWRAAHMQRCVTIKGFLAYPWDDFVAKNFPPLAGLNPNHHKGWWLPAAAVDGAHAFWQSDVRLLPLPKLLWMTPLTGLSESSLLPLARQKSHPLRDPPTLLTQQAWLTSSWRDNYLIATGRRQENYFFARLIQRGETLVELDRGFLVSENWQRQVGIGS